MLERGLAEAAFTEKQCTEDAKYHPLSLV